MADRRPVAVVDLDLTPQGKALELTTSFNETLISHEVLQGLVDFPTATALQDPIVDEDQGEVTAASNLLADADKNLAAYKFPDAARDAAQGIADLNNVFPNTALDLRADLELAYGIALLGQHHAAEADAAFALVRTLAPTRELDAARYLPEIVEAFTRAKPQTTRRAVEIQGTGRVWVDGRELGAAPGSFELTLGAHVIQLAGPDRMTRGRVFDVAPAPADKPPVAQIPDAEAKPAVKVHRARLALAHAPDELGRAGATKALADLVGVTDVVLLSTGADGLVQIEFWQADKGFLTDASRPVGSETASRLLETIAPPRPRLVEGPITAVPMPVEPPPVWHRQTRWRLGTVGVVALVVVGTYLLATYQGHEDLNLMPIGGDNWSNPGRMK